MFDDAGVTVTDATGMGVTVIADVPLLPSLVAVRVLEPAATPLTKPLPFTVAAAVLLLDQAMARPVSTAPVESFVVAVSCSVCPTVTEPGLGETVTVATGTRFTVTADVPLLPSLVAVIVTDPAATPRTRPLALTVANAALLVDHVTTRPVRVAPVESFMVAVSWTVCPM